MNAETPSLSPAELDIEPDRRAVNEPYRLDGAFARLRRAAGHVFQVAVLLSLFAVDALRPVAAEAVISLLLVGLILAFYFYARAYAAMRLWALYILGWGLFVSLRTFADATGMPVGFAYPIQASEAVFGTTLSFWLQDGLYAGGVGPLEVFAVAVYVTYFFLHYLVALALWLRKDEGFGLFITAVIVTLLLGLIVYYAVPTAPPWLASEQGHIGEVSRIPKTFSEQVVSGAYESGAEVAGSNDVAAMPSLHMAVTVVIALALARMGRLMAVAGWLYVAAMGFSLVYLGEHYLIDLIAGLILAALVYSVLKRRWPVPSRSPSLAPPIPAARASES